MFKEAFNIREPLIFYLRLTEVIFFHFSTPYFCPYIDKVMHYLKKLTTQERKERIAQALHEVVNFADDISLGFPASKLDGKVFYDDAPFLQDASTLQAFVANP